MRSSKHLIVLALSMAVPFYAAAFFVLRPDINPQTWEPGEIASQLINGEGYCLHSFAGYPQPSANQEPV